MNLLVLSDLHLEHQPIQIDVPRDADAVVLAGDIAEGAEGIIWAQEVFGKLPVFYVAGNHEFYGGEIGTVAAALREASAGTNVMLLEKAADVMGDVRFLGTTLWTDFSLFAGDDEAEQGWSKADAARYLPDFDSRISCFGDGFCVGLTPDITQRWHRQSAGWLARELARPFPGKTVVITHHAPSARSVPDCYARHPATPAYASPCDGLVAQAELWIHGHIHQGCEYTVGKCRVVCNPRGYGGEGEEFDAQRLLSL
jgi:3',5'-cyclic AMP phosphodiesterase CpdA